MVKEKVVPMQKKIPFWITISDSFETPGKVWLFYDFVIDLSSIGVFPVYFGMGLQAGTSLHLKWQHKYI